MRLAGSTSRRVERAASGRRRRALAVAVHTVLTEAVAGLRRNGLMAAAATTTMTIALVVAGGGFVVSANLAHLAGALEAQVEVVGFFRRDVPPEAQERVLAQTAALEGASAARLVTRAEALRRLQQTYRSMASVPAVLPGNPLPDSIEVRVADPRRIRDVAEALRAMEGVEDVVYGAAVVDRVVALTRAVRVAGLVATALLVGCALVIIVNTIRLTVAARRQEIEIMVLVGASPGFVRGPFLVEGLLQGAVAAASATAVLTAGYLVLAARVAASLPFLPVLAPGAVLPAALAVLWGLGVVVGLGGSEIGLRRYLAA